uniref:Uncharacterized protein n=1 Tax=Zea mays TaxID=4577 RepID=B6U7I3_MAIZE|nr:hypothetical protein [Zea mays]
MVRPYSPRSDPLCARRNCIYRIPGCSLPLRGRRASLGSIGVCPTGLERAFAGPFSAFDECIWVTSMVVCCEQRPHNVIGLHANVQHVPQPEHG